MRGEETRVQLFIVQVLFNNFYTLFKKFLVRGGYFW